MNEPTPFEIIEAFEADQREGFGDNTWRKSMGNENFWAGKVAPLQQPELRADASAYREHMQQNNSSAIYSSPEWFGGKPVADGYAPGSIANALSRQHAEAKTLADYQGGTHRSQYLPKDGDSPLSYVQRMKGIVAHLEAELPAELYAEVANAWNVCVEAVGNDSHAAVRSRLDKRSAGESVGLLGQDARAMAIEYKDRQAADMSARFGNAPGYESISGVNIRRAQISNNNVAVVRPTMIG